MRDVTRPIRMCVGCVAVWLALTFIPTMALAQDDPLAAAGDAQEAAVLPADGADEGYAEGPLLDEAAEVGEEPSALPARTDNPVPTDGDEGLPPAEGAATDDGTPEAYAAPDDDDAPSPDVVTPLQDLAEQDVPDLAPQVEEPAPLPAGAVSVEEGTYVLESNVSDELVVDAAGKSPAAGSNGAVWTYHDGANQQWDVRRDEESGWYRLLVKASEGSLALGLAPTKANPQNVGVVDAATAGDEALWAFVKNGSWLALINRSLPELLLDVAGTSTNKGANLQLARTRSERSRQRFYLLSTTPSVHALDAVDDAAYALAPSSNAKVVAEVRGAKTAAGANVWLYTANGKDHQKVYLERDAQGFYTAWVVGTGKVLAQARDAILPGTNVVQQEKGSSATQRWALRTYADGTISLVNKASGLALGAARGASGCNLAMTRDDGYKTTRFTLARKPLLSAGIVEIHPRTSSAVSLDVQKAASSGSANLLLWTDTNALNQRFELVRAGGTDLWRIRCASSGGWITDTGAAVQQQGKGSTAKSAANTWRVTFSGGGFCLVNQATGRALDMRYGKTSKGTSIIGYALHGKDSQHFTFTPATLLEPGCYFLKSGVGTYLDVADDSSAAGANVCTWAKDGSLGQYFTLECSGSAYKIKNTYSGKYLTAAGTGNGANVAQQAGSSSASQKWRATIADGGKVSFVGVASGKALDVRRNSKANGTNVQLYTQNQGAGQAWKPVKTTYQPFSGYVLRAVNKANASGSATGWLLVVDKSACRVIAMTGGNGTWRPYRNMACSVGAPATPTVEGSFVVQDRGTAFGEGYTCWYWTQFYGNYLFHSVLYNPGSQSSLQDGRLGLHVSHGCVRMPLGDAHWIYSTIPRGTRVLIYS